MAKSAENSISDAAQQVTIPDRILSRVDARLSRTDFETRSEYVTFVLEEVLARVESEQTHAEFDAVSEAEVRDRLESLGYLEE